VVERSEIDLAQPRSLFLCSAAHRRALSRKGLRRSGHRLKTGCGMGNHVSHGGNSSLGKSGLRITIVRTRLVRHVILVLAGLRVEVSSNRFFQRVYSMPHPSGGQGRVTPLTHSFSAAHSYVGAAGIAFRSTTGEQMHARQSTAADGVTPLLVFVGERSVHGRVCLACWGNAISCTGSRIQHATRGLDALLP